jgi:DNA modification methylase
MSRKTGPTPTTIDHFVPNPRNPRKIEEAARKGLSRSLEKFGDLSGITFNRQTGRLVCGHQRLADHRAMGGQYRDGAIWVGSHEYRVRIVDWDEAFEREANVAANNRHITGDWDGTIGDYLREIQAGMSEEEFSELQFDALADEMKIDLDSFDDSEEDEVPKPPADPVTKLGDVWVLGDHMLVCGDCADCIQNIKAHAFVTSPPYNQIPKTSPSGMYSGNRARKLNNGYLSTPDDMGEDSYVAWMRASFNLMVEACDGTVWINHKTRYRNGAGIHPVEIFGGGFWCEIIWSRHGSITQNAKRFCPSHEVIIGYGKPVTWNDEYKHMFTVWDIGQEVSVKEHPCPYPLKIPETLIAATTERGHTVADPFAGAGTTLIAAEITGRRSQCIEIDPAYCDVIIQRWENLTGGKAVRK